MRESLLEKQPRAVKPDAKRVRVLLIDDGGDEREIVARALAGQPQVDLHVAKSREECDQLLAAKLVDVVVSELSVWGGTELQILETVRHAAPRTGVVIVTSRGNEQWAVEAIRRGAADYIAKTPGYLDRLADRVLAAAPGGATNPENAERERERLFEQAMSLLCIIGFDGFMRRCNPSIERTLGYTHGEMMSMPLAELVHPADHPQMIRMAALLREGLRASAVETRIRTKDGAYKWILWDAVPCVEQGIYVANGHDITARKLFEQQLRESHRRFQLLASATQEAVWDWDLRENRIWQNDAYLRMFGTFDPAEETVVEWWRSRVHPDDRERVLSSIPRSAVDGQQKWAYEYRLRQLDGSYAYVYDRGFVIFDEQGQPVRMVGSLMDISQRRRAEELAHMHQAELAHMSRVSTMGEIATGIAHELNQPLTAISNYAESCAQAIAAKTPGADKKVLDWIDKIAINTHRAAEMIRRLREFTRKSEPRRSTVEVGELVREVIDLVEPETRVQQVRIRCEHHGKVHATVDGIQIQQVLVNLLRNAYEAMACVPPGERQVMIAVRRLADNVEISVQDAGEGIAPENLHRVFDAFFTSKPDGVGIGLAISRSIIEGHGGRLWVQTNPERGVTFRFTLPLSGAKDDPRTDRIDRR